MTTFLPPLLLGLVLGAVIGWLFHAARSSAPAQAAPGHSPEQDAQAQATQRQHELEVRLAPLAEAVDKLGGKLNDLESSRAATNASLVSQVQAMTRTSHRLTDRTDKLVTALRAPQIRGRWGEIQLERVIELGGMVRHCDFDTQVSARLGDRVVRPDVVVHLSGGRQLVVDAKVPFSAYLDALDTEDPEEHLAYRRRHAHLMRTHITQLSEKSYFDAFTPTPEFVVCFVPADPFLDSALDIDPELLEYGFSRNVVVATPTTLFALLRTVALGWQHEDISEKAHEIQRLGRELHQRLGVFGEHYARIGKTLEKTVEAYNSTLGSLDSRVLVTARRLAEMDISARADRGTRTPEPITTSTRPLTHQLDNEPRRFPGEELGMDTESEERDR